MMLVKSIGFDKSRVRSRRVCACVHVCGEVSQHESRCDAEMPQKKVRTWGSVDLTCQKECVPRPRRTFEDSRGHQRHIRDDRRSVRGAHPVSVSPVLIAIESCLCTSSSWLFNGLGREVQKWYARMKGRAAVMMLMLSMMVRIDDDDHDDDDDDHDHDRLLQQQLGCVEGLKGDYIIQTASVAAFRRRMRDRRSPRQGGRNG